MESNEFNPVPGVAEALEPGLLRVLAPNPSPMTFRGTNSYVLGTETLAVIDPGPLDKTHLGALLDAIDGRPVSHILVTHSHLDHSPLARELSAHVEAPVLAFGDSDSGKSPVMRQLAAMGLTGGGEGIDASFRPDQVVADGQVIEGDGWSITCHHTPGHMGNHMVFCWNDAIFSGDLVMGWASSLVSPPDGDLDQFLASCQTLRNLAPRVLYPGHGGPVRDPHDRINWLANHRQARTDEILAALSSGPATVPALTAQIYTDVPKAMHRIAARNVFAHLVHLVQLGQVQAAPELSVDAVFSRA